MEESRGLRSRWSSFLRWLLLAVLVCAAGVVVFRQIIVNRLDEEIRARLESQIAAHYRDMEVRIEGARRIEGKGIEIRGLSIRSLSEGTAYSDLVNIGEMFLECRADLNELLLGKPCVRRLIVRRMKLHATCDEDGRWNFAGLVPLPDFGGSVPQIVLEDATLELQDLCRQNDCAWALRNINVTLQSKRVNNQQQWQVVGELLGDHFKHVELQGLVDPQRGSWSAQGTIIDLVMSQRLLAALPKDVAQYVSLLATLRARAHLDFNLKHAPGDTVPVRVEVTGKLADGRVDDPRLPLPLTRLEADVRCTNQQIEIKNVTAQSGPTMLELDCTCTDFMGDAPQLDLHANIRSLPLSNELRAVLPAPLLEEWDKFLPAGDIDAVIGLKMVGHRFSPDVTVTCRDVSFAYRKFPLRLQQGHGEIKWLGNTLQIGDFTALAGSEEIHISGQFQHPGPHSTGWLELSSAGPIELDHELISAMSDTGQRIVRSLKPTGRITLIRGRIEKRDPNEKPQTRWELALNDCSVEYERFPYAIHNISGRLVLENGRWDFPDLHGYHGSSYIACNGAWVPLVVDQPGGDLTLNFKCWDVPLNDSLRHAVGKLSGGAERFWDSMRPRGTIDHAAITVQYNSVSHQTRYDLMAEKWPPTQNVEGRTISVHPEWFPLRLEDCTGRVYFSNGVFRLERVTARRGNSLVELAGHGQVSPDQQWEVVLSRLIADGLSVDHELLDAFPAAMRDGVRQLKYRGELGVNGNAWFRGGADRPLQAGWDVLLDVNNGVLDNELKLEHIYGGVRLTGGTDARGFQSRGMLDIDSLMTHGVQLTQVQGPLWLDAQQLILGSRASVVKPGSPPQQVTARAMGGTMGVDAHVILDEQLRFALDVSIADAAVAEFARTFHAQRHDISGKVYALIRLKGAKAGLHTLQGTGQVRLREADIYELPVMTRLLNLLSLRPPDTKGFTSSDVDFRLQGEQIFLDRVDVAGDVISLKGKGWMDLNRRVNLDFYALVGNQDFQLPVIRMLLAEASKSILRIQVVGDVDNPQVIKKPLPELDDTLQRLFPEAAPRTAHK